MTLLLFCGYVIIWYLQIGYRFPFLGKIRFEFIYAAILSCFILFDNLKLEIEEKLAFSVVLLFVVMLIQVPFSINFDVSSNVFIDRVVKFSFMALFIIAFVRSPRHLVFFIGAFLLACMKMGQEGFVGQLTGSMVWENQGIMRLNGPTPIYGHPNSFSGMALGTIPFVIFLYPISSKFVKFLLSIQFIFALNIVLFTGSRTGYVAFFVLLVFMFFISKKKMKVIFIIVMIIFISLQFIDNQYTERFETIFTGKDKEGESTKMRKEIISDSVDIFLENPLGVGVSAFPTARIAKFNRSQDTHNLYFEILTNLGVQGFLAFLLFIFRLFSSLNSTKRRLLNIRRDSCYLANINKFEWEIINRDIDILYSVANAVFFFIVIRLALGFFGMDLYEIYWWFSFGLTVALNNIVNSTEQRLVTNQCH